jgi:hypothetical protein
MEPSETTWREMTVRESVDQMRSVDEEAEARYAPLGDQASSPTIWFVQRGSPSFKWENVLIYGHLVRMSPACSTHRD